MLASRAVLLCVGEDRDLPGVILNKAHHATGPEEKFQVLKTVGFVIDTGHCNRAAVGAAGIGIGTAATYRPNVIPLAGNRIAGTSIGARAGCAVQKEFSLRGAFVAAQTLTPDIAIQIGHMLATDTPDMADRGEMVLGGGPCISLCSVHGRGMLNDVVAHPSASRLFEETAAATGIPLQRSARVGVLTDLSYVKPVGAGAISMDIVLPMRGLHSALARIGPDFPLSCDGVGP